MDTHNPYFTRAEVAYRQERARAGFWSSRRKRGKRDETRPTGKPLAEGGL